MTDTWYIFVGPGVHEVVFICVAIVDSIWTLAINNNSVILSLGVDAVTESFLPIVSVIRNHVQTRNGLQSILGDVNLPYKVKKLHQEAVAKKPTCIIDCFNNSETDLKIKSWVYKHISFGAY